MCTFESLLEKKSAQKRLLKKGARITDSFNSPGSFDGRVGRGLQEVDLPLQVKVGGVGGRHEGPGGTAGHVEVGLDIDG